MWWGDRRVGVDDVGMSENGSKDAGSGAERESAAVDSTAEDTHSGNGTAQDAAGTDAGSGDAGAVEKAGDTREPVERSGAGKHELAPQSRTGVLWTALAIAGVVLVFLLIFIAQNFTPATVHFLGLEFSLPIGLALLFAAIVGGVLVWLAGTARMIQMRRAVKKARKQA
ncbi:putative integral membrane protein [Saccharopolyspora dendranthemae]|uniref:Putative integral membrane protein n=2 Tax=Saccharopolyspora dendranthemae TaxID=1181886 RepID=A0A561V7C6_9PSEU|nr:putative integral membrane protein [Saccharopolyspora dendranthemae]